MSASRSPPCTWGDSTMGHHARQTIAPSPAQRRRRGLKPVGTVHQVHPIHGAPSGERGEYREGRISTYPHTLIPMPRGKALRNVHNVHDVHRRHTPVNIVNVVNMGLHHVPEGDGSPVRSSRAAASMRGVSPAPRHPSRIRGHGGSKRINAVHQVHRVRGAAFGELSARREGRISTYPHTPIPMLRGKALRNAHNVHDVHRSRTPVNFVNVVNMDLHRIPHTLVYPLDQSPLTPPLEGATHDSQTRHTQFI
jgi:hypothetical protein